MKQIFKLCLLVAVITVAWAEDQKTGSLTVVAFKNQTPL